MTIKRDHGRSLIQRGQQLGAFDKSLDTEVAIDLYAGPIYFRLISKHAPLDSAFADQLADRVLAAILIRNK